MSDLHIGKKAVDYWRLNDFLKEVYEECEFFFVAGDILDAIFPVSDRRWRPSVMIPELNGVNNPLDAVIDYAFEFLKPYADKLFMMSLGNHETSIIDYDASDPLQRLIDRLNQHLKDSGSTHRVQHGSWGGSIVVNLYGSRGKKGNPQQTIPLFIDYSHGAGGGAEVTKGVIRNNRYLTNHANAHYKIYGHNHNLNVQADIESRPPYPKELDEHVYTEKRIIRTGSWNKYPKGKDNRSTVDWAEVKEFQLQPIGGAVLKFRVRNTGGKRWLQIRSEI